MVTLDVVGALAMAAVVMMEMGDSDDVDVRC